MSTDVQLTTAERERLAVPIAGLLTGAITGPEALASVQRLTEAIIAERFAGIEEYVGVREGWCAEHSAGAIAYPKTSEVTVR